MEEDANSICFEFNSTNNRAHFTVKFSGKQVPTLTAGESFLWGTFGQLTVRQNCASVFVFIDSFESFMLNAVEVIIFLECMTSS